jgi:hypothetical protein
MDKATHDRDAIIAAYSPLNYPKLALLFKDLKDEKAVLKKKLAYVDMKYDILTQEIIPDKMAEDGFQTVSLKEGGRIQISGQAYCSTHAGMKEALFQWLRENDFEELVTEVVNPGTLKAFVKEQLEMGNPVPDEEIINYQPYSRATVVGG